MIAELLGHSGWNVEIGFVGRPSPSGCLAFDRLGEERLDGATESALRRPVIGHPFEDRGGEGEGLLDPVDPRKDRVVA